MDTRIPEPERLHPGEVIRSVSVYETDYGTVAIDFRGDPLAVREAQGDMAALERRVMDAEGHVDVLKRDLDFWKWLALAYTAVTLVGLALGWAF